MKFLFYSITIKGTSLHRTASFDVLSVKIGLTNSPVEILTNIYWSTKCASSELYQYNCWCENRVV